jgi:hypothetical protein
VTLRGAEGPELSKYYSNQLNLHGLNVLKHSKYNKNIIYTARNCVLKSFLYCTDVAFGPARSAGQAEGHSWAECSDWLYNLNYKNCDTARGRRSRALEVLFQSVEPPWAKCSEALKI